MPAAGVVEVDLAEVVLTELSRHAFEAHDRSDWHRPQPAHQLVHGALAPCVAMLLAEAPHDLPARQPAVLGQPALDGRRPRCGDRRTADPPLTHQALLPARRHRRFALDPTDALHGHPALAGYGDLGHSHCAQDLHLMPSHGSDHPSPFWAPSSCAAPEKSVTSEPSGTYQNFRKATYQNFWNPQESGLSACRRPQDRHQ